VVKKKIQNQQPALLTPSTYPTHTHQKNSGYRVLFYAGNPPYLQAVVYRGQIAKLGSGTAAAGTTERNQHRAIGLLAFVGRHRAGFVAGVRR
jgi:hypothetical protein